MARERQFYAYLLNKVVIRTVLLLGIISFGFLAVQNWVARWDLTEDKRFSISEASHRIAAGLADPLTIRAYFSERIPDRILPMQRQVFDVLAEYEAHGGGKIKVERYDPLENAAAASEAQSYGVRPIQLRVFGATEASSLQVYGSIVLIYGDRAPQVINIAERYPEGYEGLAGLEYQISRKIVDLTRERPRIGLTGYLEREVRANPFGGQQPPRAEYNGLRAQLGENFEVEDVDLDREDLDPAKVPLLLVVRPREFTDVALFRLDQYLMKGGRVLVFVTQGIIDQAQWGERRFIYEPFKTGLDTWLEHNGLRVPNEFVCHFGSAIQIPVRAIADTPLGRLPVEIPEPNWFWPMFRGEDAIDKDNPAVQSLKVVTLWWVHPVDVLENKLAGKAATVLLRSHEGESWRWKDLRRIDRRDLSDEQDAPSPDDLVSSPVAVAVEGAFTSYFADKPVPPSLAAKGSEGGEEAEGEEKKEEEAPAPDVVKASAAPTQLVVIGNAFFVSDALMGQGGERAEEVAALAVNVVDWLAGSPELIALRAKRFSDRSLVDKALEENLDSLVKQYEEGEIDLETYRQRSAEARDQQKAQWKRSRWTNIIVPVFLILFAGAVVWVVRAAGRSGPARVPAAKPPESLVGGGRSS